ncbi:hypothetical protein BGX26_001994 [Mortierella sp. AD094]|nr:hypothetical protein BGX26_001994 [Mortierella sp. AD094]
MHLVPHTKRGTSGEVTTTAHKFDDCSHAQVRKILHNGKYCFDIVLSNNGNPPEKQAEVLEVDIQHAMTKNHEVMLILLRDIHSVDVCFVFESDKTCLNVGLWAHRAILSRYKGFENAIHTANKAMSSSSEDMANLTIGESDVSSSSTSVQADVILGPLMIPVEKFTLATLCVLLRYIYTGEINLSAETDMQSV